MHGLQMLQHHLKKVKIQNKEDIKILFSYNIQKLLKI